MCTTLLMNRQYFSCVELDSALVGTRQLTSANADAEVLDSASQPPPDPTPQAHAADTDMLAVRPVGAAGLGVIAVYYRLQP